MQYPESLRHCKTRNAARRRALRRACSHDEHVIEDGPTYDGKGSDAKVANVPCVQTSAEMLRVADASMDAVPVSAYCTCERTGGQFANKTHRVWKPAACPSAVRCVLAIRCASSALWCGSVGSQARSRKWLAAGSANCRAARPGPASQLIISRERAETRP